MLQVLYECENGSGTLRDNNIGWGYSKTGCRRRYLGISWRI